MSKPSPEGKPERDPDEWDAEIETEFQRVTRAASKDGAPKQKKWRRGKINEPFAPIPHGPARKLFHHIGGPAWLLLVEIDRLIFEGGGRNPVKLTTDALRGSGLTRWEKERGLRLLEQAGVITVERKRGRCPLVTHLWYEVKQ